MSKIILTDRQCAGVMRALGDETRLKILESLLVQEKCVSDLVEEIGRQQPHVSHHLRILREAGLVEGIREGQRVCYRVLPGIQRQLKDSKQQAIDLGCCQVSFPVELPVSKGSS
jgi:DNA-binding transcriptional ArsR family regulator